MQGRACIAYFLALCLQWYNGLITSRVHSSVTKRMTVLALKCYTTDHRRPAVTSMLNNWLECVYGKFV